MNYREEKPWGSFENILDDKLCKVKKITIKVGKRPSYQYHHKRSEHWVLIQGEALVTLDGQTKKLVANNYIYIPLGARHRIENSGSVDLIFIEVQTGDYFGEDDIVRLNDDYTR